MKINNGKIPDPKEIEKEITEFLSRKFGGEVKVLTPDEMPQEAMSGTGRKEGVDDSKINFDLKPQDLISYLDRYIVRQDRAKAVLATKICTHFNRIKRETSEPDGGFNMVGRIKNNVLMIGPTGVGKTYMVRLIARKIGVPFVKGDATKFSETGYVGGDVEDLVRDLVKEADGDIDLAQYGIIYIDEIDKIASSRNFIGADVSRTGVQRALLKPMEETEVELKVPHDPISMMQEIERYRKTGKRENRTINTRNILFIVSGAFSDLTEIIHKRLTAQNIGFGAKLKKVQDPSELLAYARTEDLIEYGYESEFVGRLPVKAVFERLTEQDLFQILKNPNNPVILGKRLDFIAYGIRTRFEDDVLQEISKIAFRENTGARGLVSAIEQGLIPYEKALPSTPVKIFPVTLNILKDPEKSIRFLEDPDNKDVIEDTFNRLLNAEKEFVRNYILSNQHLFSEKYSLSLSSSRIDSVAELYLKNVMEVGTALEKIKNYADAIKKVELYFYKNHEINIVMEDDAIDLIIEKVVADSLGMQKFYDQLTADFQYGLRLVQEKTGKKRFFITKKALMDPESYIKTLLRDTTTN